MPHYTTTETTPDNNDIVHTFYQPGVSECLFDIYTAHPGNLYETNTQYYQGSVSQSIILKSVATTYNNQSNCTMANWDIAADDLFSDAGTLSFGHSDKIVNVLPTQISTTTYRGTVTVQKSYSPLFTLGSEVCNQHLPDGALEGCGLIGTILPPATNNTISSPNYAPQIQYVVPSTETTYGPGGVWLQTKQTNFQYNGSDPAYKAANLISLPAQESMTSVDGATAYSTKSYYYDDAGMSPGKFGNATRVAQNANYPVQHAVTTKTWFDQYSMPYQSQDPMLIKTSTVYDASHLYPASVTKAYQSADRTIAETSAYVYDDNTGTVLHSTDPNGVITDFQYNDPLDRITEVDYASNKPAHARAKFSYPSLTEIDASQDQVSLGDGLLNSKIIYDGLGRKINQVDAAGYTTTTTYDLMGRIASVSNPAGDPTTDGIDYSYYDPLSRKVKEVKQDTQVSWWCYDGNQDPTYPQPNCSGTSANTNSGTLTWTDFTDEISNHSQSVTDGLGRLIAVVEPGPQTNNLALETNYSYDPLGNLSQAIQFGKKASDISRTRTFTFDSLSRLVCSSNSENSFATCPQSVSTSLPSIGATLYTYDDGSRLQAKVDSRGYSTTFGYDSLNRVISKTYSSGDTQHSTPSSCFQYDAANAANSIGRLSSEWTQNGSCSAAPSVAVLSLRRIVSYDPLGRITEEKRCLSANCTQSIFRPMQYSYDLAGHRISSGDGVSGRSFVSQYDTAGRISTLVGGETGSAIPLFSIQTYGPIGWKGAMLGTGIETQRDFDKRTRLQVETVTVPAH